jgi:hypothetical protein
VGVSAGAGQAGAASRLRRATTRQHLAEVLQGTAAAWKGAGWGGAAPQGSQRGESVAVGLVHSGTGPQWRGNGMAAPSGCGGGSECEGERVREEGAPVRMLSVGNFFMFPIKGTRQRFNFFLKYIFPPLPSLSLYRLPDLGHTTNKFFF